MLNTPYYLGLDMGTNSVGWAVTDKITTYYEQKEKICGGFASSAIPLPL